MRTHYKSYLVDMFQTIFDCGIVIFVRCLLVLMYWRGVAELLGPFALLFHISAADEFDTENIALSKSFLTRISQVLQPVRSIKLIRVINDRPVLIETLHHVVCQPVDGVLYP